MEVVRGGGRAFVVRSLDGEIVWCGVFSRQLWGLHQWRCMPSLGELQVQLRDKSWSGMDEWPVIDC